MNVLILGGTGAMGVPLVKLLKGTQNNVIITSRGSQHSQDNIKYVKGDAHNIDFLTAILKEKYDVIVDFMIYSSKELEDCLELLLSNTDQYFFFSSSRVYAATDKLITEDMPRWLDVCQDQEYLETDEYALAKAREENILKNSGFSNWTIIRPYITYNSNRLQLGVYEKENWLWRSLNGRTIVFPEDIANSKTTLTFGSDVAKAIIKLIGNPKAFGQAFHVVGEDTMTWKEVFDLYSNVIIEEKGKPLKIKIVPNSSSLKKVWNPYQIKYDRVYDRVFDNSKINSTCGKIEYIPMKQGIKDSLKVFLSNPKWLGINWKYEAWADKQTGEHTPLSNIPGIKTKLKYIYWRYTNYFSE